MQQKIKEAIKQKEPANKKLESCPYCSGKIVKRGLRKKKYEEVQIYFCKICNKRFTSTITKNKTYPLKIILESLTLYNKFTPLENIPRIIEEKYGITTKPRIISSWIKEYETYLPFLRMREFISKNYNQKEIIEESKLFHQQIYNFKYHRAKLNLILEENFKHSKFQPLKEFLELATVECPNHIFQESQSRASDLKGKFNLDGVKIIPKNNFIVKTTNFITQAISNNKQRHEAVQDFLIANDSTTIAVEIPILLDNEDINHYKYELNFDIPITLNENEHITGHIDLVQVRNGSIYILDYKPSANKQKPIDQLTIYALALARLTGLRLYHFKCAYFDSQNYYEFFPLHVVYKLKNRKKLPREQTKLSSQNR